MYMVLDGLDAMLPEHGSERTLFGLIQKMLPQSAPNLRFVISTSSSRMFEGSATGVSSALPPFQMPQINLHADNHSHMHDLECAVKAALSKYFRVSDGSAASELNSSSQPPPCVASLAKTLVQQSRGSFCAVGLFQQSLEDDLHDGLQLKRYQKLSPHQIVALMPANSAYNLRQQALQGALVAASQRPGMQTPSVSLDSTGTSGSSAVVHDAGDAYGHHSRPHSYLTDPHEHTPQHLGSEEMVDSKVGGCRQ